jgi:hypothetical protein
MTKEPILTRITEAYEKLGIPFTQGQASDVEIHTEFLNAGWSIGKKKIGYDAYILLNEAEQTAYMWQKTAESSGGFMAGGGYEMSTQTGATLFRKVKIVQYGPEGKTVDIKLNLGEIAKVVQDAARQNGWKFKTALRQETAKYPKE